MVDLGEVEAEQPADGGVDVSGELDRVDELAVQRQELRQLAVLGQVAGALEGDLVGVRLAGDGSTTPAGWSASKAAWLPSLTVKP